MKHQLVGALLKGERKKQDRSQKDLCYGICAPSYLCKIEKGSVNPDIHIWKALFKRLGIDFGMDQLERKTIQKKIKEYFFWASKNCERAFLYEELSLYHEKLRYSEFAVEWFLIRMDHGEDDRILLTELYPVMTIRQQAYYSVMNIKKEILSDEEMDQLVQMCEILDETFGYNEMCTKMLHRGEYASIHRAEGKIVAKALMEGNLYGLADYYVINGSAYACMNQLDMMMDYYSRAIGLLENSIWKKNLAGVYYNMGATYVSSEEYEKGIEYLSIAKNLYQMEDFMLQHKMALSYIRLKQPQEAQPYLNKMKQQLQDLDHLREADNLKYREACMELEEGFQYKAEYLELIEKLIAAIQRDYHVGHLVFYKKLAVETYCIHRKYKKALELNEKISSIAMENSY